MADLNGLDLLVNNAGVNIPRAIQDITEDNFDYLVGLDFRAYVMLMHYASRYMIDNHIQGNIINITSSRGERAYANAGLYCGIKAGLNKMTEAFALDLSAYGIRVNNVAPGAVRVRERTSCWISSRARRPITSGVRNTSTIRRPWRWISGIPSG